MHTGPTSQVTKVTSRSPSETRDFGRRIGAQLSAGDVVGLIGELGSGKTVLVQGMCQGLGVREPVKSPSFIIITQYEGVIPVYHFDLYRLRSEADLFGLGYEEYFYGSGVTIVEWAEKAGHLLPPRRIEIRLSILDEETRELDINGIGRNLIFA